MFFRRARDNRAKRLSFTAGTILSLITLFGVSFATAAPAAAITVTPASVRDNDANAVIWGGVSGVSQLDTIYHANGGDGHNTSASIQYIYEHFGIDSSDIDNMKTTAVDGYVTNTGDVYTRVNGKDTLVATNALTAGRQLLYDSNGKPKAGQTKYGTSTVFYTRAPSVSFASGDQALQAMISMKNGVFQFAILYSCGNPVSATPKKTTPPPTQTATPAYDCTALNRTLAAGKVDTYQFTTSAAVSGGATVDHVVYDFGDGSSQVSQANPATIVTHSYNPSKSGTFKATATLYVKLPSGEVKTKTSSACQASVSVQPPFCVQLSGAVLDQSKLEYTFTVTAQFASGITFTGADFAYGDGQTKNGVVPASGSKAVSVTHQYAKAGTYNASATLHFSVDGNPVVATACSALVTPSGITPECKPGVPVGSPACQPCQYDTTLQQGDAKCVPPPPTELPNTGAGDVIAIFVGVVAAGFLVYRQLIFRKHRAAFVAAQQGRSAPLPSPFEQDQPLGGYGNVPAARHPFRRSLRRKRPF